MTQPNLLENAKQGNPESIAELMNLALQPKGITAKALMHDHCLEVVLTSERILNPKTLVAFVHKGLINLGSEAIQAVRVCGLKTGEDSPIWVKQFELKSQKNDVQVSRSSPTIKLPRSASASRPERYRNNSGSSLGNLSVTGKRLLPQLRSRLDRLLAATEQITSQIPIPERLLSTKIRSSKYFTALAITSVPAFLLGIGAAVIASLVHGSSSQPGGISASSATISANQVENTSEAAQNQASQLAEVRQYLDKMNKAQRDFYLKNGRFASSLEELERSADVISLISQTNDYAYRLTVTSGTQSLLTATPKATGMKSFTGAVFLTKTEKGVNTVSNVICESKYPSKVPPLIEVPIRPETQCPPSSARIS